MDFRSHYGFSSSPNTSDDAESHRGSPDTKLTVFSPEDVSMVKKTTAGEDVDNDGPPAFTIRSNNSKCSPKGRASFKTSDSQDPFITVVGLTTGSRNCGERPKLSPTASSFTPFGAVGMAPGAATTTPGRLGYAPSTSTGVSFLNTNSLPDGTSGDTHLKQYLQSVASEAAKITPIGQRPASGPSTPTKDCEHHDANLFSVDTKVSRSLIIGNVSRKTSGKELSEFFDVSTTHPSPVTRMRCHFPESG